MTLDEISRAYDGVANAWAAKYAHKLIDVAKSAEHLLSRDQLGKVLDTSCHFEGKIVVKIDFATLVKLRDALDALLETKL